MTPDRSHRNVVAADETTICSTIDARQLMQYWSPATYANLVSGDTNLLCYWRMDSKSDYQEILDIERTQSCWWNKSDNGQTTRLTFGVPGAISGEPDTAVQFNGSTLLISPMFRDDIPTNSALVSLSATGFTLETWVQVKALNSNQWFFAHDNGSANSVDVLLGLSSDNHFKLVVGTDAGHSGFGDVLESATVVTQADVNSNSWFHVVAVHDLAHATVALYINGTLETQTAHTCHPVALASAPHLGSRGLVNLGANGYLGNTGFDFFSGALDEVAVYSAPLTSGLIRFHYQTALGLVPPPVTLSASWQDHQLILTWPAAFPELLLQTTGPLLSNWQDAALSVQESNGVNRVVVETTNTSQFFRLKSP
jgi:hypothetical protein